MTKIERETCLGLAANFRGPRALSFTAYDAAGKRFGPLGKYIKDCVCYQWDVPNYDVAAQICESLAYEWSDGPR